MQSRGQVVRTSNYAILHRSVALFQVYVRTFMRSYSGRLLESVVLLTCSVCALSFALVRTISRTWALRERPARDAACARINFSAVVTRTYSLSFFLASAMVDPPVLRIAIKNPNGINLRASLADSIASLLDHEVFYWRELGARRYGAPIENLEIDNASFIRIISTMAAHLKNLAAKAILAGRIGEALRAARKSSKKTLREWAAEAGCTLNHLALCERGERKATDGLIARLPLSDADRAAIRVIVEGLGTRC